MVLRPTPVAPSDSKDVEASKSDAVMLVRTPSAEAGQRGGTTLDLDADLVKRNGKLHPNERHVAWESSNEGVATVDTAGIVVAHDTGTVQVVAWYKDKNSDTVRIAVKPVPVARVDVTGADSTSLDDVEVFRAAALDSVGEELFGRAVAWSSSDPAVANVNSDGNVFALTVGTTEISATIDGTTGARVLRVWPQPVVSVEVTPATVSVPQFRKVKFTAVARDKRGNVLTDRPVTWSSSDAGVFYITANADTAAARDVGQATVVASVEGKTGEAAVTVTNPVEARALWVNRLEYTNFNSVDFAKIATIFQKAASANFNVVYFQVRTSGDALYYSDIEPCSPRMCGSLGGPRPSRDPLVVALQEAAKHGIQVHAWLNVYTGFIGGSAAACNQFIASTPMNWLKAHPEWSASSKTVFPNGAITHQVNNCATASEYMYVSPGVPAVRSQVARVAADIARRYGPQGLQGIHLDRARFSASNVSYDSSSLKAFRDATGAFPTSNFQASWSNFRRGFVNQGVKEIHDSVQAVNRALALSAAVWPGYQSRPGWVSTWSYSDLFQDPQAWAQGGYLDVEVPMIYTSTLANNNTTWSVKAYCSNTDFTCAMDDHLQRIERTAGRHVYVGIGAIRGWAEMKLQLDLARDRMASGVSIYSYSQVDAIPNGWAQLAAGPFKRKATIPAMAWK